MARATGTLEGLNQLLSDAPTDIDVINARVTIIATMISNLTKELKAKLEQTSGPIDAKLEQETLARIKPLGRELELLLAAKRRLQAEKR
jgi:hypothetical protein